MKKIRITAVLIAAVFVFLSLAAEARDIKVSINGKEVKFDTPPVIWNDRTFVPIRAVSEMLGADVYWYGETRGTVIVKNDIKLFLQIGDYYMYSMHYESFEDLKSALAETKMPDGIEEIKMDVFPIIKDDRTLLPIRYICEALGADVEWDEDESAVRITYGGDMSENTDKDFFDKYIEYYLEKNK